MKGKGERVVYYRVYRRTGTVARRRGIIRDIVRRFGKRFYIVETMSGKRVPVPVENVEENPKVRKKKRRKNPVVLRKGRMFVLPTGARRIYAQVEKIWCRKGGDSHYPYKPFEHTFSSKPELWGLPDGSLLILPKKGKRLWGMYRA